MADPYLLYLYNYNAWANRAVLDWFDATPGLAEASAPGTFGTAAATMNHLLSAEAWYLNRLASGPSMPDPPPMGAAEMRAFVTTLELRAHQLLEELPEAGRLLQRSYGKVTAATVFGQLIVHGIEHRTQICSIIGTLVTEPPDLSSWRFGGFVD